MKFKLLKDLPWASKGQVVYADETVVGGLCAFSFRDEDDKKLGVMTMTSNQFYDWFEEVDERWKPEEEETYYYLDTSGSVGDLYWFGDSNHLQRQYNFGNCFRTRELAERAAEQIKALLKEFHKNNP